MLFYFCEYFILNIRKNKNKKENKNYALKTGPFGR